MKDYQACHVGLCTTERVVFSLVTLNVDFLHLHAISVCDNAEHCQATITRNRSTGYILCNKPGCWKNDCRNLRYIFHSKIPAVAH